MTQAAATFSLPRDSLQAHEISQRLTRFQRRGYQRYLIVRQNVDLNFFWTRRWFFITMLVGSLLMIAPTPEGLTEEGQIVLAMSVMATMLFVTEAVPLPTVPLLIIIGQVVILWERLHHLLLLGNLPPISVQHRFPTFSQVSQHIR